MSYVSRHTHMKQCCCIVCVTFDCHCHTAYSISHAWFPPLRIPPPFPYHRCPLQKYVRITFIRKNSTAYVKSNVLRFRRSPLPLIRSYRIEFYFSVPAVPYVVRRPGAPPTLLRGKLVGLPPGPAALLPRTRPSNGIRNARYGNAYRNGHGNVCGNEYGNGNVMLETRCHCGSAA